MPSEDEVEAVQERGSPERAKSASERAGESELREEHDASPFVARDWQAIAEYEPPTFLAPFVGY